MSTGGQNISKYATLGQLEAFFINDVGLLTVKAYGAVGDGVTDDTTAILAAIADVAVRGVKSLYFPHGTYKVDSLLISPSSFTGIFCWGDNSSLSGISHPINQIGTNISMITTFLGLTDTPGTFAGQAAKVVSVNEAEDALEFTTGYTQAYIDNTFYTKTELGAGALDGRYYTETELGAGALDGRYYTETELSNGALDGRYYTETELNNGALNDIYYTETELDHGMMDKRYYTETEIDANFYNKNEINGIGGMFYSQSQLNEGQLDNRYYTETELSATTLNDSGAKKIGIPSYLGQAYDLEKTIKALQNEIIRNSKVNVSHQAYIDAVIPWDHPYDPTLYFTNMFYDIGESNQHSYCLLDNESNYITIAASINDTVLYVADNSGFFVGQELTIQDINGLESVIITELINDDTITIKSGLQNNYKIYAQVYRSGTYFSTNKLEFQSIINFTQSSFEKKVINNNYTSWISIDGFQFETTFGIFYICYKDGGNNNYGTILKQTDYAYENRFYGGSPIVFDEHEVSYCKVICLDSNTAIVCYNAQLKGYACLITSGDNYSCIPSTPSLFHNASATLISACKIDTNKIIVTYAISNVLTACVITVSEGTITAGTPYELSPQVQTTSIEVCKLDTDKAILCYMNYSNNSYGTACVLSVSGTTITAGTPLVFESAQIDNVSVSQLDTDKAIVAYTDVGNSNKGTACVLNVSNTTISAGAPTTIGNNEAINLTISSYDANNAIICYSDSTNNDYGTAVEISINNTTIQAGTPYVYNAFETYEMVSVKHPNVSQRSIALAYGDGGDNYVGTIALIQNNNQVLTETQDMRLSVDVTSTVVRYDIWPDTDKTFSSVIVWISHSAADLSVDAYLSVVDTEQEESYVKMEKTSQSIEYLDLTEAQYTFALPTPTNLKDVTLKIVMERTSTSVTPSISKILGTIFE